MKIMGTSFERSHAGTVTLGAPQPCSKPTLTHVLLETLDTPRQVWVSLL